MAAGVHETRIWELDSATAARPVGAAGGLVTGWLVTAMFQLPPPLLSHVPALLLKTMARVVAPAGTV